MSKRYKLLVADGKFYESDTKSQFGGNSKLKKKKKIDCPSALSTIKRFPGSYEKVRVFFFFFITALAAGYRPCVNWLRAKYKQYKENEAEYKAQFGL